MITAIEPTLLDTVRNAVARSIDVEVSEVEPAMTLFGDLELESIDLLDVFFRIEEASGVSLTADDLAGHLQGGIPDDVFSDDQDVISAEGLTHLESAIPGFRRSDLSGPLKADEILELVTVETVALVTQHHQA